MRLPRFAPLVHPWGRNPSCLQHVHSLFMTSIISPGMHSHEPQGRHQRLPEHAVAGPQLADETATENISLSDISGRLWGLRRPGWALIVRGRAPLWLPHHSLWGAGVTHCGKRL